MTVAGMSENRVATDGRCMKPTNGSPPEWGDEEDEEFLEMWDQAEAAAVDLLRRALPSLIKEDPPTAALGAAADRLRARMKERAWPYDYMRRAAGFQLRKLPKGDLELWLSAAGGLIVMREDSGMGPEEEASLVATEHADWLGAVVGLVRAGVGASAEPEHLVAYINDCPEIDGEVDPEDCVPGGRRFRADPAGMGGCRGCRRRPAPHPARQMGTAACARVGLERRFRRRNHRRRLINLPNPERGGYKVARYHLALSSSFIRFCLGLWAARTDST